MAEFTGKDVSWKQLWQLVSGIHYETPNDLVAAKLTECTAELRDGLLSKCSVDATVATVITTRASLHQFSTSLQHYLGLSAVQASNLICSYLVHEYKGSAASLLPLLATDAQRQRLLGDLARYHALERMVLLKCVRNVLELHASRHHPYAAEYAAVLRGIGTAALLRSYIAQLAALIAEPAPAPVPPMHSGVCIGDFAGYGAARQRVWSERRQRELAEVLHIVLLLVEHDEAAISGAQVAELFALFRLHSFGRQQQQQQLQAQPAELAHRVQYAEVALFVRCCSIGADESTPPTPQSTAFATELIRALQPQMPALVQHAEHGPVLLAWMLFNFRHADAAAAERDCDDVDERQLRLRQFGARALQLGVFDYWLQLLQHGQYGDQSAVARCVRRTVYAQLTALCRLFDADGSVAQHRRVYELLAELLRTPTLAKDFCGREDGVRSLWQTALENFPLEWRALSEVAEAVASTGAAQQAFIRAQLEALPIYTEVLRPASSYHLKPAAGADSDNEFVLLTAFAPFAGIDYAIPAGTTACVLDRPGGGQSTIHFRTPVNYFQVLHHEINELLAETLRYAAGEASGEAGERERRVCAGIRLLGRQLRNVSDPLRGISSEMVHPTEMVFDVLTKFKAVQQPPVELLARCLEVCANLVPLFDEEIVRRVVNLGVLPVVAATVAAGDCRALCQGVGFESGLVGHYLINIEKNCGRYEFLHTYLEFLHVHARHNEQRLGSSGQPDAIELPGLVFMLREILPHMHGWHFEREADRQRIYTSLFKHLLRVLQAEEPEKRPGAILLRNVCVESLLQLDNGLVLLRFIAIGNDHLQSVMQNVSNWMTAAETGLNHLVQLAMTTLMQILRLRNKSAERPGCTPPLSPLESIIYTQPKQRDTLRIIPCVTSYMSNIFNRRLPLLACRLLRRFALEFQMSLLACLDMEPDQIRLTFLARLPDDLESDQLKMAVIEFVEACIHKQPGLTEAFFRIRRNERRFDSAASAVAAAPPQRPREIGDGILTYMTQYLCAVAEDPQCIGSPLLSKILALFHALWKNNMQSLVQELRQQQQATTESESTDFWPALCKPLFADIQPGIPAYSQLFNMLGIELFRAGCGGAGGAAAQMDPSLVSVLRRLLQPECLNRWVDSVLELPRATCGDQVANETPEWLRRLQSFKDFIVLTIRRKQPGEPPEPTIAIPAESLRYFAERCLDVLCERAEYLEDYRPFIILAELYLMLMLSGDGAGGKYTETTAQDDRMLEQITRLLNQTAIAYRELHARARESVLAIGLRAVVLLAGAAMEREASVAAEFMRSIVVCLCFELQATETQILGYRQQQQQQPPKTALQLQASADADSNTPPQQHQHQSFVLALNLLKQISASCAALHEQLAAHWTAELIANRILNRLLSCLNAALPVHRFRRIVVEMLDVLIDLAQSPACSAELLYSDIVNYLWIRLLPPKEMLQIFGPGSAAAAANASQTAAATGDRSSAFSAAASSFNATHSAMHIDDDDGGSKSTKLPAGVQTAATAWQTNDWWPIYARGLRLVTVLLQQHRHVFLKDALLFVGVHEEYVVDAVMLAKQTLDVEAVRLIKTALLLVCELVRYEKHWRLEHAASLIGLMRSVQSIMDHSVSLLYRPVILQRLIEKTTVVQPSSQATRAAQLDLLFGANQSLQPTPELITAMNDLVEFVTIASRALLAFSPRLLDMLVEPRFDPAQWQPLVEIQFGAPKLYVGSAVPQLTFGTILSAVAIFTKSLALQNFHFYETPINRLTFRSRSATGADEVEDADGGGAAESDFCAARRLRRLSADSSSVAAEESVVNKSSTRSLFTKSLSMTSTTSAASAATTAGAATGGTTPATSELLSRLDDGQCVRALELVLTMLCSQSLLALRDGGLSVRDKQLIKRELSTELAGFHEFVRRRVMPTEGGGGRDPLQRRKRGVALIRVSDENDNGFETVSPSAADKSTPAATVAATQQQQQQQRNRPLTMREKVMRQQHQQHAGQKRGGSALSAPDCSPIASGSAEKKPGATMEAAAAAASTPIVSILAQPAAASTSGGGHKRVTFPSNPVQRDGSDSTFIVDRDVVDTSGAYNETVYIGSEDSTCSGLSLVQLVESDYLHLLSLVFMHICQHD